VSKGISRPRGECGSIPRLTPRTCGSSVAGQAAATTNTCSNRYAVVKTDM